MKVSMFLPPVYDERKWTLARQIGIRYAITKATSELTGQLPPYDFFSLRKIRDTFEKKGFILYGLEGDQFDMSPIKLGGNNRNEYIDKYCRMLQNMGKLNIPLLCFNWMAGIGWFRSQTGIKERGGALTTGFDMSSVKEDETNSKYKITEDRLWENLYYFLEKVLPVAENAGVKMALHPDDPPVSPLKGIGRILTSAQSFDQILRHFTSPNLGITFCQATFKTMGEDIKAISAQWLDKNKIFFIHLRNITGDNYKFNETFIDNGEILTSEMLAHYYKHGFCGPIRSDHAPAMYGESPQQFKGGITAGYDILGHIYATGYIKGICEAQNIPIF